MLGFVLIEQPAEERARSSSFGLAALNRPTFEGITRFTRDLALLLKAGVRINDALELLSSDTEFGRLRPVVDEVRASVVAGESFADALSHHPTLFPVLYTTLVGIGEATYAPAASAMISERFSERARARAMGVFQAGMVVGGGVGIVAGSLVGGEWGWRTAFLVVGIPGLMLTLLCLLIAEAPPRLRKADTGKPKESLTFEAKQVMRSPGVFWIYAAGVLITFILAIGFFVTPALMGGPGDIMIAMLIEREVELTQNWPAAAIMTVVLLTVTLILYGLYSRFSGALEGGAKP